MTIWKFPFSITDNFDIEMPDNAKILAVQMQKSRPCIWALVEPSFPKTKRKFRLAGTGHSLDGEESIHYIGTFQTYGGKLVFHLFEVI